MSPFATERVGAAMAAAVTLLVSFLGIVLAMTGPAYASAQGPGKVVIVDPNTDTPVHAGGSRTPFALVLPKAAACPGDTAHQEYNIDSFVEPAGTNVAKVYFRGGFPQGAQGTVLGDTAGDPYMAENTVENTGAIPALPIFTWAGYSHQPNLVSLGTYEIGLICADRHGYGTSTYWSAHVHFTLTSSDPGGFTWTVVDPPKATTSSSDTKTIAGFSIAVIVIGGFGYFFLSNRARSSNRAAKRRPS
jgi:hypothetical protein